MTFPSATSVRLQEDPLRRGETASAVAGGLRHSLVVRVTHWISAIACFALLFSGAGIVTAHPRFYWGEVGTLKDPPAFTLPVPSSRKLVPTRYGFVLPDYNGGFRKLHFEAAWALVLTGLVYASTSLWTGHFKRDLFPERQHTNWRALREAVLKGFARARADGSGSESYNAAQRFAYLTVIFVLAPLLVWTGLALSPAFDAAFPAGVAALGGRQTARTLHLLVSGSLLVFVVGHIAMVILAGFKDRMRAMITGRAPRSAKRI